jgi:hypothetical protein
LKLSIFKQGDKEMKTISLRLETEEFKKLAHEAVNLDITVQDLIRARLDSSKMIQLLSDHLGSDIVKYIHKRHSANDLLEGIKRAITLAKTLDVKTGGYNE